LAAGKPTVNPSSSHLIFSKTCIFVSGSSSTVQ
jgi:hypothetical protein